MSRGRDWGSPRFLVILGTLNTAFVGLGVLQMLLGIATWPTRLGTLLNVIAALLCFAGSLARNDA